jgi:hypothetical protein
MYTSKSTNTHHRTEHGRTRRYEHNAARTAVLKAVMHDTDRELRLAVRGTWIECELPGDASDGDDGGER